MSCKSCWTGKVCFCYDHFTHLGRTQFTRTQYSQTVISYDRSIRHLVGYLFAHRSKIAKCRARVAELAKFVPSQWHARTGRNWNCHDVSREQRLQTGLVVFGLWRHRMPFSGPTHLSRWPEVSHSHFRFCQHHAPRCLLIFCTVFTELFRPISCRTVQSSCRTSFFLRHHF